ncbi:MAG TPA: hypothetical protein VNR42_08155, partial [Solirubrobacteraceae bacterium]|nr:hypothetical protein [Solirubrobacteraceae bacterium]
YRDPGVGAFGLQNTVFALGDRFLEIVSPIAENTTAGRYLQRHGGDGGYMVIFDIEDHDDFEEARSRALALGVRVVFEIALEDIETIHLHPADMRGAIVSLDRSDPYGSWRWGGPDWTGQIGTGADGRLIGVTIAVDDPSTVAARWAEVLGVATGDGEVPTLLLDEGEVRFEIAVDEQAEGLVEIAVSLPHELPGGAETVELGGVRLRRVGDA